MPHIIMIKDDIRNAGCTSEDCAVVVAIKRQISHLSIVKVTYTHVTLITDYGEYIKFDLPKGLLSFIIRFDKTLFANRNYIRPVEFDLPEFTLKVLDGVAIPKPNFNRPSFSDNERLIVAVSDQKIKEETICQSTLSV